MTRSRLENLDRKLNEVRASRSHRRFRTPGSVPLLCVWVKARLQPVRWNRDGQPRSISAVSSISILAASTETALTVHLIGFAEVSFFLGANFN
jgi:hypothetical protein